MRRLLRGMQRKEEQREEKERMMKMMKMMTMRMKKRDMKVLRILFPCEAKRRLMEEELDKDFDMHEEVGIKT
jgi:hypothetical protein